MREAIRLAISINGEGRGHVTRMIALAERLGPRFDLSFWCPATVRPEVEKAFPGALVEDLPHIRFVYTGFEVDYIKTALANAPCILEASTATALLVEQLAIRRIKGVLSDFEPFLPGAATRLNLPILQLNHPGVVTRVPDMAPDAIVTRVVAAGMMSSFDERITCSFFEGDVGPIIRKEIRIAGRRRRRAKHFVVYEKPEFRDALRSALAAFPGIDFRFFPTPGADFAESLASCRGIIAPSGHQIISEALHLGKPIFVIPMSGTYEQRLNAAMLARSGRGAYAYPDRLDSALPDFIDNIDSFPRRQDHSIAFKFKDDGAKARRLVTEFFENHIGRRDRRTVYRRLSMVAQIFGLAV
jgi:UDP:flavonoid glycosyltransferase YjiC (YdhE family)